MDWIVFSALMAIPFIVFLYAVLMGFLQPTIPDYQGTLELTEDGKYEVRILLEIDEDGKYEVKAI